jgi:predicted NBD/HSP70 family sugar kinase
VLRFNPQRNHIIGVEMGASHVSAVLCDLFGRSLWNRFVEWDVPGDPEGTLQLIEELVEEGRSHPEAHGPILGLGVGVPSPVDDLTPDRLSPRLLPRWIDVRLAATLHERFGVRIFVDNDANCGALAQAIAGAGRNVSHFSYIKVATGIGAGHIVRDRSFRGFSGIAGEIGHASVDPNGRRCRCGLRGCLEAEIGSQALIAKATEALRLSRESVLSECSPLKSADIVSAALDGDALARDLVAEAGGYLGTAVANLLNLMNPARVVIGGRLAEAGDLLLEPLRQAIRNRALWTSVERADVVLSSLGEEDVALGAAMLVLRAAFVDLSLFQSADAAASAGPLAPVSRIWRSQPLVPGKTRRSAAGSKGKG